MKDKEVRDALIGTGCFRQGGIFHSTRDLSFYLDNLMTRLQALENFLDIRLVSGEVKYVQRKTNKSCEQ